MTSSTNNRKINPFYISQDDDDEDDNLWDEDENEYYGSADIEQTEKQERVGFLHNNSQKYGNSSYYHRTGPIMEGLSSSDFDNNHQRLYHHNNIHQPQYWKYIVLVVVILVAIFVLNKENNDKGGDDYYSLIDEIPNDEYRIVVLGERHFGTSWIQARVQECFPHTVVSTNFQRPGYFFQDNHTAFMDNYDADNTIIIHVTLNIYDWLEHMRLSPEYSPNHIGKHAEFGHIIPLEWKEFIQKPWTMERPDRDLPYENFTGDSSPCQFNFPYNQIISCIENPLSGHTDNPLYELQQDGTPYNSIIDLRNAKLLNHYNVRDWDIVKKFITIRYETVGKQFQSDILEELRNFTGWKSFCSGNVLPQSKDQSSSMTVEFINYVTQHTNWKTESIFGYEPWTTTEIQSKGIIHEEETEDEGESHDDDDDDDDDDQVSEEDNKKISDATTKPTNPNDDSMAIAEESKSNTEDEITDNDDKDAKGKSSASKVPPDKTNDLTKNNKDDDDNELTSSSSEESNTNAEGISANNTKHEDSNVPDNSSSTNEGDKSDDKAKSTNDLKTKNEEATSTNTTTLKTDNEDF